MGRIPCCEKDNVKRGQWTPEEDNKLSSYIAQHGTRNWRLIPKNAGLQRCGKSCRLRWTNYLRPDLKHGEFSDSEEHTIVKLHSVVGNRWSLIAAQLPGRTDNDVKNHWNTKLKKKLSGMGIDPVTHKPFSHLMAEIANTLAPPHVAHLTEAALGCFKDEMLHLLTKKRVDFQITEQQHYTNGGAGAGAASTRRLSSTDEEEDDDTVVQKIKLGVSRAMQLDHHHHHHHPNNTLLVPSSEPSSNKQQQQQPWTTTMTMVEPQPPSSSSNAFAEAYNTSFPTSTTSISGFQYYGPSSSCANDGDAGSPWNQSICTGSTCTGADQRLAGRLNNNNGKGGGDEDEDGDEARGGKGRKENNADHHHHHHHHVFNSTDCVMWDLTTDDDDLIMNPSC